MIPWLFYPLRDTIPGLSVFRYVTFRAAMAAAAAMILSLLFGPLVIRTLTRLKMNQPIRAEGPENHQAKAGTPTMGGTLIVGAILVSTLLWCDLTSLGIWVALVSLVGFGAVGALTTPGSSCASRTWACAAGRRWCCSPPSPCWWPT